MNENRAEMHVFCKNFFSLAMKKEVFEKKNTYLGILKVRFHDWSFVCLFVWGFTYGMKEGREEPSIIGELKHWTDAQSARHLI